MEMTRHTNLACCESDEKSPDQDGEQLHNEYYHYSEGEEATFMGIWMMNKQSRLNQLLRTQTSREIHPHFIKNNVDHGLLIRQEC